jgi:hypothetical protein
MLTVSRPVNGGVTKDFVFRISTRMPSIAIAVCNRVYVVTQ